MTFKNWLATATTKQGFNLSERTVERYYSGLRTISKMMLDEWIISKRLEEMTINELDLAISLIFNTKSFINKDNVGKKIYSNDLKRYRCYIYLNFDIRI